LPVSIIKHADGKLKFKLFEGRGHGLRTVAVHTTLMGGVASFVVDPGRAIGQGVTDDLDRTTDTGGFPDYRRTSVRCKSAWVYMESTAQSVSFFFAAPDSAHGKSRHDCIHKNTK